MKQTPSDDNKDFGVLRFRAGPPYEVSYNTYSFVKKDENCMSNNHTLHVKYIEYGNININICSIKLKWDGKTTEMWYDNDMRWIRIRK